MSILLQNRRRWVWLVALFTVLQTTNAIAGIVYTSFDGGYWSLFYRSSPTAPASRLGVALPAGDRSAPRLSPDGTQVAFEITGVGVFLCPVPSGEDCTRLTSLAGSAVRPSWLPDGTGLVFAQFDATANNEDSTVSIIRQGMPTAEPLLTMTGVQDDPEVSADGRWLLFTSGLTVGLQRAGVQVVQQLWITDLQTGVSQLALPGTARDMQARWSPEGRRFAFASDRSGRFEIWVADRDGGNLRQVTNGPGSKTWPSWSPQGNELVFTRALLGRLTIWRVGVDGSGMRPMEFSAQDMSQPLRDVDWR